MIHKFVFDQGSKIQETMHRRVNSNVIDFDGKQKGFHRRTLSNSDLKLSPLSINPLQVSISKSKPQMILPDSLNSSAVQPQYQGKNSKFLEILDISINHFSSTTPVVNPLKQISELKNQIMYITKNIDMMRERAGDLASESNSLKVKTQETQQENDKLQKYLYQLQNNVEKLKSNLQKSENELKILKRQNKDFSAPATPPLRRDSRAQTLIKPEAYTSSSDDEIDVFNPGENTCMPFNDPFKFGNPSPKVQGKSLYQRIPFKK